MNGKNVKLLRSQIRNVVQEILPEILTTDLFTNVSKEMHKRLDNVTVEVRETLKNLDDRSKTVQDYIVRQVQLAQTGPAPSENALETNVAKQDSSEVVSKQ